MLTQLRCTNIKGDAFTIDFTFKNTIQNINFVESKYVSVYSAPNL